MLNQLDTEGIPPTTSALPLNTVLRSDIVGLSLSNKEALYNAPDAQDGSFRVRAVLD
jgi:aspartyl-tRNA(Asn)/glutamyl-tRNA(Gln) amidotransferase subunit C